MAENKRYYWMRLQENFFTSKRIKKLRRLAGGDTFTIIYLKMQLLSITNNGVIVFTGLEENFAEEVALDIDEDVENVRITVQYLLSCGLLETTDNIEYVLPYAQQNIGSETASTQRSRKSRENKALELEKQTKVLQCNTDATTLQQLCNVEKEKEIDINNTLSKDNVRSTSDVQRVVNAWNELKSYGIKTIRTIHSNTQRYTWLNARLKQYGLDSVLEAIENIKSSDFLCGGSKKGWVIDFDWFVRPNNFIKVLEGKYNNKNEHMNISSPNEDTRWQ